MSLGRRSPLAAQKGADAAQELAQQLRLLPIHNRKSNPSQNIPSQTDPDMIVSKTGWMMWNYIVSALAVGARIVLYDGSPMHPQPTTQLDILVREK